MASFTITEDYPKNKIEFDQRFSTPQACYEYLFKHMWPDGFLCKKCGNAKYWLSSRNLYICTRCEHQHSLTAGTIMDSTKKPITYWFRAMWWFTTRKTGINATTLKAALGFGSYGTDWCWLQKPRRCTIRQDREKLSVRVDVDEMFIGGKNLVKKAEVPRAKPLSLLPLSDETRRNGWVAFVYTLHWIARHSLWKHLSSTLSNPAA